MEPSATLDDSRWSRKHRDANLWCEIVDGEHPRTLLRKVAYSSPSTVAGETDGASSIAPVVIVPLAFRYRVRVRTVPASLGKTLIRSRQESYKIERESSVTVRTPRFRKSASAC